MEFPHGRNPKEGEDQEDSVFKNRTPFMLPGSASSLSSYAFGWSSTGSGSSTIGTAVSSTDPECVEKEHMFDKVVTRSDVGKLNRLVIPKQYAEKYFPLDPSTGDKGLLLCFEDRTGKQWRFRYSYWNSSQSYVMTVGWSRFVKEKRLDAGDTVSFGRGIGEQARDRLFIDWKRRSEATPGFPVVLDSVPIASAQVTAKQRVRLFGVNLDSPESDGTSNDTNVLSLTMPNWQSRPVTKKMSSLDKTFEVGGSSIYGRADDIDRIIKLISSENGTDLNSTVLSIVSDRGSGRTTLLHLLQNELCTAFDKTRYICMPENFNEKGIMRLFIESLTGSHCDITDLEVLKETVKEELIDQRLLFLLDDFENERQECWDLLLILLKVCKGKSVVVVTATREVVAKVKGPMQFYNMTNLSKEWCWMIFQKGIFPGQNPDADIELVEVGKCLVERCRNVTLCIKMLSGVLKHSIGADRWRAVLDNNFWEVDEVDRDILPALRVCYEYLPFHLKLCFKYCSLFPKEYFFSKQQLVRMWLSQGFIEPVERRELEDIGLEYFDQLLSRSFFQASFLPDMKEDRFVMPGLIHNLAKQFSKNECFQFEGCIEMPPENACHLALVPHEFQLVSFRHLIIRAQNLQTLLVLSRSVFQYHGISSSVLKFNELEDLFIMFPTLITLDLSNADVEELPESLGSLKHLRYLNLSSTNIKKIPLELSNLIHLQTLEAKDCNSLGELPKTISALTNLHYLDVTKQAGYVIMPDGIGKLTNLRNLPTINVGMDPSSHCRIDELKDMKHLKGRLEISGLENVRSATDAKEADMRNKDHIENLCFQWSDEMSYLEGENGSELSEEILESLYPTENLTEIIIRGYPGNSFPMWIGHAAFCRLVSIIFDNCYNCERLPALGELPMLRFLSIRKMYSVQRMSLSGSEYTPENFIRYPSLEQLTVWEMYGLVEWIEIGKGNFPILHSLRINKCPLLRNVPNFPALVELSVYSYAQFIETVDLPSLHSLRIEGLQKTESIILPNNLVRLKKLEISRCTEPLSIKGLSLLNSLETIIAFRCAQFDSPDILDERLFSGENRGNNSVWLRKKNIAPSDKQDVVGSSLSEEGRENSTSLKKRKDIEGPSSLSWRKKK